jgi:hypothetical protein
MIGSMVAADLESCRGSHFLHLQATMLDVGCSVASCVDLSTVSLGTILTYKKSFCIRQGLYIYKISTCHPPKTLNLKISTQTLLGILCPTLVQIETFVTYKMESILFSSTDIESKIWPNFYFN